MIDLFTVFHRGGAVLWAHERAIIPGEPINSLVQQVLLEERKGETSFKFQNYLLKWAFDNELDLVFVAVYLNFTQLFYIDELLEAVKKEFVTMFRDEIRALGSEYPFEKKYLKIVDSFETRAFDKTARIVRKPRTFAETKKGQEVGDLDKQMSSKKKKKKEATRDEGNKSSVSKKKKKKKSASDNILRGNGEEEEEDQEEDDSAGDQEDAEDEVEPEQPQSPSSLQQQQQQQEKEGNRETEIHDRVSTKDVAKNVAEPSQPMVPPETRTSEQPLNEGQSPDVNATPNGKKSGSHQLWLSGGDEEEASPNGTAEKPTHMNRTTSADSIKSSSSVGSANSGPKLKGEAKLQELRAAMRGGRGKHGTKGGSPSKTDLNDTSSSSPEKPKKKMATSAKKLNTVTQEQMDELDFSKKSEAPVAAAAADAKSSENKESEEPVNVNDLFQESESENSEEEDEKEAKAPAANSVFSFFSRLIGNKPLTHEDLEPVLKDMRMNLMTKNVAADIAEKLCESVASSLEGKKVGTFTTIKSIVKKDMEAALTRILTPKKSTDIMQGIIAAKAQKRPYSIVFVGVNGVGKSTSLAKLAAYFCSKKLTVAIAACDTFRSGAVEQLRTHAKRLNIPLFERGYNKDAAAVAAEGIREAKRAGIDVILIDTSGRMQDNEPLMRALSKLINVNKPDLVLFVGEALVGNDAVDQLTKFNQCLADLSTDTTPRLIDGIILTKFDTVDDKVGSAISMTYTTGQPIMFVGTGQRYGDLKQMNVKTLIKALLK